MYPDDVHIINATHELLQFPIKQFLNGPHECEWGMHVEYLDLKKKHSLLSKLD